MKATNWHFKYHLCKAKKLTSTTYHPNHPNNVKNPIITTNSNTNTITIPSSHSRNTKVNQINKVPNVIKRAKWTYQHLKDAMGAMEKGHTSLQKAVKYWNIPLISFSNHFNCKTKSGKTKPQGVLTKKEDATIITWLLKM